MLHRELADLACAIEPALNIARPPAGKIAHRQREKLPAKKIENGGIETLAIGIFGYVLLLLGFHPAPILLGFVLGPRFEENFRRAMLLSRGDIFWFVERPISAVFVGLCVLLIVGQLYVRLRRSSSAT